jgi:hypothetical protein
MLSLIFVHFPISCKNLSNMSTLEAIDFLNVALSALEASKDAWRAKWSCLHALDEKIHELNTELNVAYSESGVRGGRVFIPPRVKGLESRLHSLQNERSLCWEAVKKLDADLDLKMSELFILRADNPQRVCDNPKRKRVCEEVSEVEEKFRKFDIAEEEVAAAEAAADAVVEAEISTFIACDVDCKNLE